MRIVGKPSASCKGGRYASFGLICRDADVDVRPATPRFGWVQALERHVRIAAVPIDDVLIRSEALIPEDGRPERTYVAAGILCYGDAHDLNLGGVWLGV